MRLTGITLLIAILMITACTSKKTEENPFFAAYNTPFDVPPFDRIKPAHFIPAFEEGMRKQASEIETIVSSYDPPTFENVILPYEYSGKLLGEVSSVFYNMNSAHTSEEIQAIARDIAPKLSEHNDNISMNIILYDKIKEVYKQKDMLGLDAESTKLVEEIFKSFVRNGADLIPDEQAKLRGINQQLSVLSLKFGENVLAETNDYQLIIDNEADLDGLPPSLIEGAAKLAKEKEMEGKWIFTLHNPSVMPFLQYSSNRELRKKMQQAYILRCDNNNEKDNKDIIRQIVNLRVERAKLLGYPDHASYILAENMARDPITVYDFVNRLWDPTMKVAKAEAYDLQKMLDLDYPGEKLQPWDWRYYTEKLRKEKYDLDEEQLRPYFKLENVREGIFDLCDRLWGLKFIEKTDIPKLHPDAIVYEVTETDGSHIGILYMDFHPRPSKRSGAWMSNYREQMRAPDGKAIHPIVTLTCNFSPSTTDAPSLLTLDEVQTFFHEFGHGLHGLLSNCTYRSLSGTNVPRDFVELPSQIMEHWASAPEFLKMYARHYQSGESIPDALIERMQASQYFNQGFITGEFLAATLLDMDYHTLQQPLSTDINAFETQAMTKAGLIVEIVPRYRSTYFQHIFSGGYSAGYYSYIWSALLDADAFEAFKETGLFNKQTAALYRTHILERGATDDPMNLYVKFRGRHPSIEPLLKVRGLL